jgi:putative hydrolase of the HAD superfamily
MPAENALVLGFDADDTLWEHASFYKDAEEALVGVLIKLCAHEEIISTLRSVEGRNLSIYGFGVKGFTLSMLESATLLAKNDLTPEIVTSIIAAGHSLMEHPIRLKPLARETLNELSSKYKMILITRGDLFEQDRKLRDSNLRGFFHQIEIVSDKTPETYRRVFAAHGGADRAAMIGNSLASDIVPALRAGAWGLHIPHSTVWAVEHCELPSPAPRYKRLASLGELPLALRKLSSGL